MITPRERAKRLLSELSLDEKLYQLSSMMYYEVDEHYEQNRNPLHGHYRNPGHFMHASGKRVFSPAEVAEQINRDVKASIEAQPHHIPPIEHGEALHGVLWGMGTMFPHPIGMAATFDDDLVLEIGDAIGKECIAVGVRQILAPVVNITRDCRWGRCMESFGEDVLINSNMGANICKGLEQNGVIATPKHYVDNYSYGGRDSHASDSSERHLREVYLKPFEKCVKEGGAHSIMPAYNSWEGVPCSCNKKLLEDILRNEWGFEGFAVSDYGGVDGICWAHYMVENNSEASARSLNAGLEVNLPFDSFELIKKAYDNGLLSNETIDKAVLRVLTEKYRIGLFDEPYVDVESANEKVRTEAHKDLALRCARESIVLLKNEGILPLDVTRTKKVAVFGASANELPLGKNYSGPYNYPWTAEDAKTPLGYLEETFGNDVEFVFAPDSQIEEVASKCDVAIYFTTTVEGEGMDRSDIRLPSVMEAKQEDEHAIIVGKFSMSVEVNQEESIRKMTQANTNAIVVLLNGAPVDMTAWEGDCKGILEAWYPGEQGARALGEILFGMISPSGKLPISVPRNVGQVPIFYSMKPSGRGYGYNENDGTPLYPFGFGLSYTSFSFSELCFTQEKGGVKITFTIENVGAYDGAEVVQVYVSGKNCDVVLPLKEMKAYKRVHLQKGEKQKVVINLPEEAFYYYDSEMNYGLHKGNFTITVGTSCTDSVGEYQIHY